MRDHFSTDWAFAMRNLIEVTIREQCPSLLRSWPILHAFDADAYEIPLGYLVLVLKDKLHGIPRIPSVAPTFPHAGFPRLPPDSRDIPLWRFFFYERLRLRSVDAAFLLPPCEIKGKNTFGEIYDCFSLEEQHFFSKQLEFVLANQKAYLENEIKSQMSSNISYNLTGNNARVNVGSTDSSTNVSIANHDGLFDQLRRLADTIAGKDQVLGIQSAIAEMEQSVGRPGFLERYQRFIAITSDHIGVFGPIIPQLSALIGQIVS